MGAGLSNKLLYVYYLPNDAGQMIKTMNAPRDEIIIFTALKYLYDEKL